MAGVHIILSLHVPARVVGTACSYSSAHWNAVGKSSRSHSAMFPAAGSVHVEQWEGPCLHRLCSCMGCAARRHQARTRVHVLMQCPHAHPLAHQMGLPVGLPPASGW